MMDILTQFSGPPDYTAGRELAQLLELAHDSIFVRDMEDRILYCNEGAVRQYGWPKGEAVGQVIHTLLRTQFAQPVAEIQAVLHVEGAWEGELVQRRRNGEAIVVASRWVLRRDERGRPVAVLEINNDITAHKQAQEDLRRMKEELEVRVQQRTWELAEANRALRAEIEQRRRAELAKGELAAIVRCSDDAIIGKSLDGVVTSWNAGAERLFGYTAAEIIGRPIAVLVPPERSNEIPRLLDQIRHGQRVAPYETVRRRKDGRRITVSLTLSPIRDPSGRIVGAAKIARDITEQKRAQEALREADRRKDEFLAMLAHELRNPLAPIRTAVEILKVRGPTDAHSHWARDVIDRQVGHLTRLVDDLLDVSRITRGKVQLLRQPLELAAAVARAVETSRPLIDGRGHQLIVSLPPEPVSLDGDLTRLAQVLANLLNNAAKYTPEGGRIELTVERNGQEAVLRVRDSGMGIPAEMLPKVFDLFTQGERALDRAQGGLGIGLTLVRSLVELHGGSVSALSEGPDRGSEFVVRLPLLQAQGPIPPPEHAALPELAPFPHSPSRRRILLVDDNRDAVETLTLFLQTAGHEVIPAADGPTALEIAQMFRPEVVLLDIGLPGMTGYDVARRLRREPGLEDVLLVALTGYGREEDRRRAAEAGFDHHLVKPADPALVEQLLARETPAAPAVERS
jgi:PAS domain S-box-containing protein